MRSELREVIHSLPRLLQAMRLTVDEIHQSYDREPDWLTLDSE